MEWFVLICLIGRPEVKSVSRDILAVLAECDQSLFERVLCNHRLMWLIFYFYFF